MIYQILEKLISISGTNDRIAELAKHKDNEVLKRVLFLAHDPNTTFGMKQVPAHVDGHTQDMTLEQAFVVLDMMAARELTGHAARDAVIEMLSRLSPNDRDVVARIIRQDLRIAMGITNINKAIHKDFLKDTPYMRCELTTKKTVSRFKWKNADGSLNVVSEIKMDGQYLNHFVRNGVYSAESRNGKPYDFMGVMDDDFARLADILLEDYGIVDPVLTGEAVCVDSDGNYLPRTTSNGIVQKFGKDSGSLAEAEQVVAVLWDVLPGAAYKAGHWAKSRKERRTIIDSALAKLGSEKIRMVEWEYVADMAHAWAANTKAMANGEEGTIIKDDRGEWKDHTSPWQLKMKLKFPMDLIVVGFEYGDQNKKNKESLGAIIVESACGRVRCKVGTGFKEKAGKGVPENHLRQYIMDHQEEFMGAIVEVEANDVVQDKNSDLKCLFLGVFIDWRFDKTQADDLERIYQLKESAINAVMEGALK